MGRRTAADQHKAPNSALIIVDMQNDFVRAGAPLEVPDARDTVSAHDRLISAFRERDYPVVYTKFLSYPEYYLLWEWSPQCQPETRCCWKGHLRSYADIPGEHDCSDIVREIYPEAGDIIIEKHGYGAFHGTDLMDRLVDLRVGSLILTGTVTQICVEETAREAFHHGFATTVVADAASSFAPHLHTAALENFAMKFGWVRDSRSVVEALS